jgi:hypothetical protein
MLAALEALTEMTMRTLLERLNGVEFAGPGVLYFGLVDFVEMQTKLTTLGDRLESILASDSIEVDMANLSIAETSKPKSPCFDHETLSTELERIRTAVSTLAGQNRQLLAHRANSPGTLNRERKHWTTAAENAEAIQKDMRQGPSRVIVGRALHAVKRKGDIVRVEPLDAEEE